MTDGTSGGTSSGTKAATTAYVALLRGINVGGARKVPMAGLRQLLADRGYGRVRTLLQSGNAVFTGPEAPTERVTAELEAALADRFGFSVDCLVLTAREWREAVGRCPFPTERIEPTTLHVLFLGGPPADHPIAASDPDRFAPDAFRLGEHEIFVRVPDGLGRSALGRLMAKPWPGGTATARNWRTVVRLRELADEAEAEAEAA
ncbi:MULTISPECIES: DUF1697 domain-containing protein [Streptomyces]|uniref:DUF1697 domain-containing protein n=1 Tax=Streptomyces TaxID=1883 RepID=UPI000CD50429|nr:MULTISPECIES: DUF1697 domain-containing protein [Streptomyces]